MNCTLSPWGDHSMGSVALDPILTDSMSYIVLLIVTKLYNNLPCFHVINSQNSTIHLKLWEYGLPDKVTLIWWIGKLKNKNRSGISLCHNSSCCILYWTYVTGNLVVAICRLSPVYVCYLLCMDMIGLFCFCKLSAQPIGLASWPKTTE